MRQARVRFWGPRRLLVAAAAAALATAGPSCQPCYYYCDPGCTPGTAVPSTVRTGSICDVPPEAPSARTSLAEGSTRTTTVSGATPSSTPRVVVSQPSTPSRFSWRRTDPDGSLATTRVQGAINDSAVNR